MGSMPCRYLLWSAENHTATVQVCHSAITDRSAFETEIIVETLVLHDR